MYIYKFKAFAFLSIGIILALGSIIFVIDKDYMFAIKIFSLGVIFIIASLFVRKWAKRNE